MKKGAKHKILKVLLISVLLILTANPIFAAINDKYIATDPVVDVGTDSAIAGSELLDLLAKLVYAVGRLAEKLLGRIFFMLTGVRDFPWADKLVFNAVALVDVNFINPAGASFVGNPNIQGVLKNTYATIMAIAISFFGIFVLVTSIKLVISTIASQKAKYKQAIVDWSIGLLLLFCMHYAISFMFYLNEELVKVASLIVVSTFDERNDIVAVEKSNLTEELLENIRAWSSTIADQIEAHPIILQTWVESIDGSDTSDGLHEALAKKMDGETDKAVSEQTQYDYLHRIIKWAADPDSISSKELRNFKVSWFVQGSRIGPWGTLNANIFQYITNDEYLKIFAGYGPTYDPNFEDAFDKPTKSDINWRGSDLGHNDTKNWIDENLLKKGDRIWMSWGGQVIWADYDQEVREQLKKDGWSDDLVAGAVAWNPVNTEYMWTRVIEDLAMLRAAGEAETRGEKTSDMELKKTRLLTDLATYFKYGSHGYKFGDDGSYIGVSLQGDQISVSNMLMYAILVVQSLILFIAYIKRMFYVIILALMAPIVVAIDFFTKFGK